MLVGAIKSLQSEAMCKADLRRELMCGLPCPFERSRSPRSPSSAKAGFQGLCEVSAAFSGLRLEAHRGGRAVHGEGKPGVPGRHGKPSRFVSLRCSDPSPSNLRFSASSSRGAPCRMQTSMPLLVPLPRSAPRLPDLQNSVIAATLVSARAGLGTCMKNKWVSIDKATKARAQQPGHA